MALEAPASRPEAGAHHPPQPPEPPPTSRRGPGKAGGPGRTGEGTKSAKTTKVVSPRPSVATRLREIWVKRELLVYLVRTEIKVKYKNSFLGLVWSMVSPALTLLVFTLVFGVFLKNGIPDFVIFLFAGLLLWNFFQTGVISATGVIVNNAGLVKKVSFPREILALAAIGSAGVFLFFQACVMALFIVILSGWFHSAWPAWDLLWLLPVGLIPCAVFAAGLALLLAAINVYLRDTQHLIEVLVGAAWFWACPIVYSYQSTIATKLARHGIPAWVFLLNPMTPLVMTFQRVLYNRMGKVILTTAHPPGKPNTAVLLPPWPPLHYVALDGIVLALSLVLVYVGMVVFGRLSGNFAEEL